MTKDWSVAVFTSREDADALRRTLRAVLAASAHAPCIIDVLVDGNPAVATELAAWTPEVPLPASATLRLWLVPWRDKACTWNRYVQEIAPDAAIAFFIDGYVRPAVSSLTAMADALIANPEAWAATGVPTVGRSAAEQRRRLLAEGGLHGNLYALRGEVVRLLRSRRFHIPLGLYRNDSLIGAVISFSADPARWSWEPARRIAVVEDATWDNDVAPALSWAAIRGYWKRRLRQAQGDLENAAVRRHLAVLRLPPEALPRTTTGLLRDRPDILAKRGAIDRALIRRAARRLSIDQDWARCDSPPRLLRTWDGA